MLWLSLYLRQRTVNFKKECCIVCKLRQFGIEFFLTVFTSIPEIITEVQMLMAKSSVLIVEIGTDNRQHYLSPCNMPTKLIPTYD